jgi:two-component system sensor histidine kinase PilS (NtrC family)
LIIVFLISDLTNKIEIENILKEKEHLALIGEMAAGIAHEIRNPLASISGSVQFLKNDINLKEEHKNLMDIIIKESDRLSNSIEEFLDFTKCTPLNKTKFNLSKLIDDTLTLINTNNKNIKFVKKYNNEVLILADEKKIQQVVWNLLSNSIKAVKGNGIIEITIIKGKKTAMYIKDDGIGIGKVELKKIFLPFYSKFTSGIGLGMAIVKRILNEHEAKIKIISKKNLGTEIKIIFGDIDEHN